MINTAIQVKNLYLEISGKRILHNISFNIQKGEFFSIIGPNGAGKTSLIKCISRIMTGWTGLVHVNGVDLQQHTQRQLAQQISYVPQAEGRNLPFTVFEFVLMGRYPHLSPFSTISAEDKAIATEMLDLTGLRHFKDRMLNTLSGGERQMAFIAAALAQGAEILLLDEPTSFLDYQHQAQVKALLSRLNVQKNLTIVSISHDINAACEQSSRILAMKDGASLFIEEPENMLTSDTLQSLYQTPFAITDHPVRDGKMAFIKETT